ncbi:hypothetical protein [Nocardioides euryhalodurans]|uniref:Guanylate cyclase n=1 Tax=Nocardioides euryhalodurans TaxID=2518370 RepID=A0A4P7GMI7_9ACTN|nr:hypothetical protein [Nocardioides euryhalodurans]QBR92997.1 hypothetical protein EXE57_12490 [Nocardioides euryhalodurans]
MVKSSGALSLDEAVSLTRTGDLWLFRGRSAADRAIRTLTNAPVNHVGMALVLDDLPPLMWHAELGRSLPDLWTGDHHRGVQLHDLRDAVTRWQEVYEQEAWLRQLDPLAGRAEEDAALRAVARLDGVSFPSTARLAGRWLRGRDGYQPRRDRDRPRPRPEAAYCAEVVALTLQEMGLLETDRKAHWYDPGTFWSGEYLPLSDGWSWGGEVAVARG